MGQTSYELVNRISSINSISHMWILWVNIPAAANFDLVGGDSEPIAFAKPASCADMAGCWGPVGWSDFIYVSYIIIYLYRKNTYMPGIQRTHILEDLTYKPLKI